MVAILPFERWHELETRIREEFDAELPNKGKADIIAELDDDGNILSFVIAEHLMRVGQICAIEDNARPRKLIQWLEDNMPKDTSVIAIAYEDRFGPLFEKMQMRKVQGTIYRRDF